MPSVLGVFCEPEQHMAAVQKRGKKWYAIYADAEGKQRQKSGYTDKMETLRLAQRLEDEGRRIRLGDVDPQVEARRIERAKPIESHLEQYKTSLEAAGRSAGHVAYTVADVQKLIAFGALKSASEITVALIDRWVTTLKLLDANKTVNRRVSSVQQFLRSLSESGGVTRYLLNRYPKLPIGEKHCRRTSRHLSAEETSKLLHTPDDERRELYTFALRTGLRANECRQILPEYVDFEHRIIRIPAHVAKSKRDQVIPIHAGLMDLLKVRCEKPGAPLFRVPTKKCVNRNLRADCKRVDVESANVSFHSLRHTFCTHLARANVHPALLQKLARHADLKTTLAYYVHLQREDESAAINRI